MPSWVGDATMATAALGLLRDGLPGSFVGVLVRPGIDELLDGLDLVDHWHVERGGGVMGPKHVASKLRAMRYDAALLFTNSFSTALITRLAFIPRRVGYERDARGLLLTDRIAADRVGASWIPAPLRRFKPVPAIAYYEHAARWLLGPRANGLATPRLRLTITPEQHAQAERIRKAGNLHPGAFALLNPGGNNPLKRWPADRFAALAEHLWRAHGLAIALNGAPGEAALLARVREDAQSAGVPKSHMAMLTELGITLGALKGVVASARIMITNDTGPRHIAAALQTPCVTLFGPTDPRWTTLPDAAPGWTRDTPPTRELFLVADPSLPPEHAADDHSDRCRIDRIPVEDVIRATERVLQTRPHV